VRSVICGAGGFLGSNLRKHLEGNEVVVLPVEMLMDINSMHKLFDEPYHLYYLAAYGNLHGQENVQEIYRAIVNKFLNLLEATKDTPCEAIITAGTTSEYGNKTEPMKEDMFLEPQGFYGAAKAGATHLAQAWAKNYNSPIVVFRPSSMTGVGEQSIHLIPTLIRSCMFKEAMPFVSEAYHDYINVSDVCNALEILADNAKEHAGEVFNVGTGVQTNNNEIKDMLEVITKEKANISTNLKFNAKYASEVWMANSDKMKNLGWKPKKTLYQSLKEMVNAV